jgi:hypothetical protein
MNMTDAINNADQTQRGRPFEPGNTFGRGRPEGSRNKATLLLDALASDKATAILEKVVAAAEGGDIRACELVLNRVWPPRKGSPRAYPIRNVEGAADIPAALSDVLRAVASGEMTAEEGGAVAAIIETQRKMIELTELETRIAALEAQTK